jgi:hypothetical protein
MKCILCSTEWPLEKVAFSSVCEKCGCWLHSCVQCRLWDGRASMCRSMTTEPVPDREGKNFCEEWQPHEEGSGKKGNSGADGFNRLFGG